MIFQNNTDYFAKRRVYFKGDSGGGDSYDAAYNARMATIAEAQQGMAEEYFDFWQTDYRPMEQAQIDANMRLIPSETELNIARNEAESSLIPSTTELGIAQNESALSLLPGQTELTQAQITDTLTGLKEKAPVRTAFFNEALNGVNVDERVSNAGADAAHAFKNSNEVMRRDAARMGINPNSGRFTSMLNSNSLNRAKTIASARDTARTNAEDEKYQRLTTAMGY